MAASSTKKAIKSTTVKLNKQVKSKTRIVKLVAKAFNRIIFIRSSLEEKNRPIGCMAYRTTPFEGGLKIQYGLSTHDPKDEFNRAIGRKVAEGRLNAVVEASKTFSGAFNTFVMDSSKNKTQHTTTVVNNRRGQEMVISGTYITSEPNMVRGLSDLFGCLSLEEMIPNRIRKHMQTMSRRVWQPTGHISLTN